MRLCHTFRVHLTVLDVKLGRGQCEYVAVLAVVPHTCLAIGIGVDLLCKHALQETLFQPERHFKHYCMTWQREQPKRAKKKTLQSEINSGLHL
ncbi:MAG: hypothetical protein HY356_04680 [Gammaproteobacteria bacterium]|nr:hypothetical protein [Gammaproteobacteria bacterium]